MTSILLRGKSSSTKLSTRLSAHPVKFGSCGGWSAGCGSSTKTQQSTTASTSATMDLVSFDDVRSLTNSISSTLQLMAEQDVASSTCQRRRRHQPKQMHSIAHIPGQHRPQHRTSEGWDALAAASIGRTLCLDMAHEMDLVQASKRRRLYDKILLLVHHAEDESQVLLSSDDDYEVTDSLTRKGVGQALNLSRRTATFCTRDVGLAPELFVVSASRKVLQTTFLSFPYDTPHHSIRATPWICHPSSASWTTGAKDSIPCATVDELQREFQGIDFDSLFSHMRRTTTSSSMNSTESMNRERLSQSMNLLDWLEQRHERVVVVSGDSAWLQAIGCVLNYDGAECAFSNGEMRVVGIRFS